MPHEPLPAETQYLSTPARRERRHSAWCLWGRTGRLLFRFIISRQW